MKTTRICDKAFKNGPSKICGRQPLKTFTWSIIEYFAPYVSDFKNAKTGLKIDELIST